MDSMRFPNHTCLPATFGSFTCSLWVIFPFLFVYTVFRCFLDSARISTITVLSLSNNFYFVHYLRSIFKLGWLFWKFSTINILTHLPPAAQLVWAYRMKTNFKISKGLWKASSCWQRGKRGAKKKEHSINSLLVFFRHLVLSSPQKNCKPKYPPPKGLWEWAVVHSGKMQTLKVTEDDKLQLALPSGQQHTGRAGSLKAIEDSQWACWTPWITWGREGLGNKMRAAIKEKPEQDIEVLMVLKQI